jgi:transposase
VIQLTGANRNDSQQALALVDAIPPLQGERGRPRHRPDCVLGDRGYDAEAIRQGLRDRGIIPFLAKRNTEHGSGLGRWRWVVERTFAWLNQFRRLRILVSWLCPHLLELSLGMKMAPGFYYLGPTSRTGG